MWKQWVVVVPVLFAALVGCQPAETKVKVAAPGVNVEVKKGGGVEVKTPGGEVKVNP